MKSLSVMADEKEQAIPQTKSTKPDRQVNFILLKKQISLTLGDNNIALCRWWEDPLGKSSVLQGGLRNMSLVPAHPCSVLPYVSLPNTKEDKNTVLGRDILPTVVPRSCRFCFRLPKQLTSCRQGMRVSLTEAGISWCKTYDAKYGCHYYDEGQGVVR